MTDDERAAAAAEVFKHFDRREGLSERSIRLKEWALSVFCWDGLLPIAVIGIPNLVRLLLPNWQFGLAMLFILCPLAALSVRFVIGWQRMRRGQAFVWQMIVFTVAISSLFLFEMFLLNDQIAGGPKIADPTTLLVMFLLYITLMAVALFPFATSHRQSHSKF